MKSHCFLTGEMVLQTSGRIVITSTVSPEYGEEEILPRDHCQVAMTCLGRVHEERRSSGTGERRGNLAGDMPGFAHYRHHDSAGRFEAELAGGSE